MELYIITKTVFMEWEGHILFSYKDALFPHIEQHICIKENYWRTLRKVITEIYKPDGEFTDAKFMQRGVPKKLFKHIITNGENTTNLFLAEYQRTWKTTKKDKIVRESISVTKQNVKL